MSDETQAHNPQQDPNGKPPSRTSGESAHTPRSDETAAWNIQTGKPASFGGASASKPAASKPSSASSSKGPQAPSAKAGTSNADREAHHAAVTAEHGEPQAIDEVPVADGLRFIRELGRGGLGSVWLAVQELSLIHI